MRVPEAVGFALTALIAVGMIVGARLRWRWLLYAISFLYVI